MNLKFFYGYGVPILLSTIVGVFNGKFLTITKKKSWITWWFLNVFLSGFMFFPWVYSWTFIMGLGASLIFLAMVKYQKDIPSNKTVGSQFIQIFTGIIFALFFLMDVALFFKYFLGQNLFIYQYIMPIIPSLIWCLIHNTVESFINYMDLAMLEPHWPYKIFSVASMNMAAYGWLIDYIFCYKIICYKINGALLGWAFLLVMISTILSMAKFYKNKIHITSKKLIITTSAISLFVFILNGIITLILLILTDH
jgi:hypothetical protein